MKIDLTDLEEDILTVAKQNPDMTNEEIAEKLNCSASWVGEVRGKYESKIPEDEIPDELNGSYSGGGGFDGGFLFIEVPIRFTLWMLEVSIRATVWTIEKSIIVSVWVIALPFRILDALFGGGGGK